MVASIQWAIMAINGVLLGYDHISIVKEAFPIEFCDTVSL